MSAPKQSSHIPALDGLRAIAVLLVLLRHGYRPFWEQMPELSTIGSYNILVPLVNGWVGVDLFFVLSGFLITYAFIRSQRKNRSIKSYALKRVLRIVPAYYTVLALSVLGVLLWQPDKAEGLTWRVTYHLLFLQDYLKSDINPVFWSLGVEEKFYILAVLGMPALVAFHARRGARGVLAFGALVVAAGFPLRWMSYALHRPDDYTSFFYYVRSPFHSCLDPLAIGVVVAMLYSRSELRPSRSVARGVFSLAFVGLLALLGSHALFAEISWFDVTLQPLLIATVMGGLVFGAVHDGAFRWLGSPVLAVVAKLSYSLYLVHLPLWTLGYEATRLIPGAESNVVLFYTLFLLCYGAISFAAAGLLYAVVERPFLRLKDRL